MIVQGLWASLIVTLGVIISSIFYSQRASKGKEPKIRTITAIDRMDEVILRCVETGKSCHMNPGEEGLTGVYGPQTIAGLTIINYAMIKCAQLGVKMIVSFTNPQPIPLASEMMRAAYIAAGTPDDFSEDSLRYIPDKSYRVAVWGINKRENVGALIGVGTYKGAVYGLFESAKLVGAMSIGGTARMMHVPTIAVQADYFMIGEEIFAAQAYLDKDPLHLGCLVGQDIAKIACIIVILLGLIFSSFGLDLMTTILKT